mgnify:CR=1 FL=1|tara:strand:- start:432 stop:1091 length:660 start_codon:yes stop_codon:yes gene_type:complete
MSSNLWSVETQKLLEAVRINSTNLSEYHRKRYYYFKNQSKYYDLPILFISAVASSFAVGSQPYLEQRMISLVGCALSTTITLISSVKLYLNLSDSMKLENDLSKSFYELSIDIFKTLSLKPEERGESGIPYLQKKYSQYAKLVASSNLLKKKFKTDQLIQIPEDTVFGMGSHNGSDSDSSDHQIPIPTPPSTPKQKHSSEPSPFTIIDEEEEKDIEIGL